MVQYQTIREEYSSQESLSCLYGATWDLKPGDFYGATWNNSRTRSVFESRRFEWNFENMKIYQGIEVFIIIIALTTLITVGCFQVTLEEGADDADEFEMNEVTRDNARAKRSTSDEHHSCQGDNCHSYRRKLSFVKSEETPKGSDEFRRRKMKGGASRAGSGKSLFAISSYQTFVTLLIIPLFSGLTFLIT